MLQTGHDSYQTLGNIQHETRKVAISWPTMNLQQHFCKFAPYGNPRMDRFQFKVESINYFFFDILWERESRENHIQGSSVYLCLKGHTKSKPSKIHTKNGPKNCSPPAFF
jgi:hypothetical protein